MPDATIWERTPHTAIKHQILRAYLGAWFAKLAWNGRVLFVDGFAGPGRYSGDEEGSPLIALDLAMNHSVFDAGGRYANCERVLLFYEADEARFHHLEEELAAIDRPDGVVVHAVHGEFADGFTKTLNAVEGRLAPAFVMIDPFGWKGFPFALVEQIGAEPRSEVMVSFMIESINRWISHPQQETNWTNLFGSEGWREMPENGSPDERRDFLIGLYQDRLRDAGFSYQWKFELRDEGNRPEYFLAYGSHSLAGLAAMKEGMWSVAPDGSFSYSDFEQGSGQMSLFIDSPDPEALAVTLCEQFAETDDVSKAVLDEFVLTETPFVQKHLNAALRLLQKEDPQRAVIRRPEGRRASYLKEVWVSFH